jgi:hypothetical protein
MDDTLALLPNLPPGYSVGLDFYDFPIPLGSGVEIRVTQ